MVSVACNLFLGNIVTLGTHNDKLDELLDTNQALTTAWTTGAAGADLQAQLTKIQNDTPGTPAQANDLNAFIAKYLTGSGTIPVSQFSQAIGTTLMQLLAANYAGIDGIHSGQASVDSSAITSFNGIVSATGNNEQQIGQNLGKTEGSVVQTDAGAQQTFTGIVDAVEGFVSIVASLLQQLYS